MEPKREQRTIKTELRVAASGDGGTLMGYAASFNSLSTPLPDGKHGVFREKIAPGAFDRNLRSGADVVCLQQHDQNRVLGRTKSGTLQLRADSFGLYMQCQLPTTSVGQDLRELVRRGDIDEMSFGFTCRDEDQDWDEGEDEEGKRCTIRTLRSVDLFDVSAVIFPAYPTGTSVQARSQRTDYIVRLASDDELRLIQRQHLIGAEIAADVRRAESTNELRERMEASAGIVSGRRRR